MTVEESNADESFRGLMKSLNLDETQFKTYKTNFSQLTFSQLSETKQEIESQLELLFDVLNNHYNADMSTDLLTSDGFPRNDIDVVGIRLVRVKIIRLRNDNKEIISLLEDKLIEHFQLNQSESFTEEKVEVTPSSYNIPFALVKEVVVEGPAHKSGLQEGDKIVLFGDIHAGNHNKLSNLVNKVRDNIDNIITISILRDSTQVTLELTPTNNWHGQGLLGCRLLPL